MQLGFEWKFIVNQDSRLHIDITYTKIKPGVMKVELGGKVVETVAVEVTNLIINKASIIFRNFIGTVYPTQPINSHPPSRTPPKLSDRMYRFITIVLITRT